MKKCIKCGTEISDNSIFCNFCGTRQQNYQQNYQQQGYQQFNSAQKSKLIAGLLGIFLGVWGVHWFYLGYAKKAWLNLGLFLAGFFLSLSFIGFFFGEIYAALAIIGMFTAPLPFLASTILGVVQGVQILGGSVICDASGVPLKEC
jgi:TM2 domain-containing membrane protein YozV